MIGPSSDSIAQRSVRLRGKVAIVTGAGSRGSDVGIGGAAAILLARAGAKVVLVDQFLDRAETTREIIEREREQDLHQQALTPNSSAGDEFVAVALAADISKPEDCKRAVDIARDTFGRVDVLVNNVGIDGPTGTAVHVDVHEWDNAMRVNVTSMMLMAKYAIPEMLRTSPMDKSKGTGKAIINLASVAGLQGGHHAILYPTSKGAVINMTRAMAAHHGLAGIRVNAIAPGMVYTPMVRRDGMSKELREARKARSLLQIEGYAWDIAHSIVFLASEEARWITGAILRVDAGATAGYTAAENFGEPGPMTKAKL